MAINLKKMGIYFLNTLLFIFINATFISTCRGFEGRYDISDTNGCINAGNINFVHAKTHGGGWRNTS